MDIKVILEASFTKGYIQTVFALLPHTYYRVQTTAFTLETNMPSFLKLFFGLFYRIAPKSLPASFLFKNTLFFA